MKTRLYYSFMVGTALAMGNMRGHPEGPDRPAIVTLADTHAPGPAQAVQAPAENQPPAPRAEPAQTQPAAGTQG